MNTCAVKQRVTIEMKLAEIYRKYVSRETGRHQVITMLDQTHWFTVNADFDPKTGEALPQALSAFLARVSQQKHIAKLHDRLWRITEHARPSIERILRSLNENPSREQAILPIRSVRELDVSSFIKLSKRPGRNIREKLAGRPYLHAVRRFQSVNLPENRLLKAFATRLVELLELRNEILGEKEDELVPKIRSWLLSDEAKSIARWDNTPPNNTLLSHRDYGTVWDTWRWLQTLNDDMEGDLSAIEARAETIRIWDHYAQMYSLGKHYYAEMPVFFDYETFSIQPWVSRPKFLKASKRFERTHERKEFSVPVCIDFSVLHPFFAIETKTSLSLPEHYLWQQWKNEEKSYDIALFNSDALFLHPDAISIATPDLLFSRNKTHDGFDRAARAFATRLRESFKSDKLCWLVPDYLNDFELEVTRRNLNALFPDNEPLPRSVAAAFREIDYSKLTDGFPMIILDCIGGRTCVTKLIARFDPDLKKCLPETRGFYLERCPSVIIANQSSENTDETDNQIYDMITYDDTSQWRDSVQSALPVYYDAAPLKGDPRIGGFAFCINISESPVCGGIRLKTLQKRAGEIPLWRDQIPELSIKVFKDGYYQRFNLVSRGTTVKPIRGLAVQITVEEEFTLPRGKRFFEFPLFQGENAEEIGFHARLDSPAFPLKEDTVCKLKLTFEYGNDEPYKLIFTPNDMSFRPVRATWRPNRDVIVTNAPAPEYPEAMTWSDLSRVKKIDSDETSDLLEWVLDATQELDRRLIYRPQKRYIGKICSNWQLNNNIHYTYIKCDKINEKIYTNEHYFTDNCSYDEFDNGYEVSFELYGHQGKHTAKKVSKSDYNEPLRLLLLSNSGIHDLIDGIHLSLYFPIISIWGDGRSIKDSECPRHFKSDAQKVIKYFRDLACLTDMPLLIREELFFLLACLHKDTVTECVQWITEQFEAGDIQDPRAIGFALGDVSQEWQKEVLRRLVAKPDASALRVFANAIWREEHFVKKFSLLELKGILNALSSFLNNVDSRKLKNAMKKGKRVNHSWFRSTVEPLELLLGLLRTRASEDTEIKMLLQPHQSIAKELAKQVERITEILVKSQANLYSRVQLDIKKPDGDRTPDLLYALRLYLTGDDGANAIHITGVSDSDEN